MAVIEIKPLGDKLEDEEVADLKKALGKAGAKLPELDEQFKITIADNIDGDVFADFLDRLDDEGAAADIYLPLDFEDRVDVGDFRVGSASQLLEALEALRDELEVDEEEKAAGDEEAEEEEDDDEDALDFAGRHAYEQQLKRLWKAFYDAAEMAIEKRTTLFARAD